MNLLWQGKSALTLDFKTEASHLTVSE